MNLQALTKLFQKTSIQLLIIILITIIAYFNILQNGLSFDDRDFLLNWPTIRDSQSGLSAFLSFPDLLAGELPSHHRGVYRPIRSIYYLLSLQAWGFSPFMFHLQAIFVHTLIVILIYFISKILTKNQTVPFLTAALFAAHPIHTEAVTYTAASFDTLGILFFFGSFYFYLKAEASKLDRGGSRLLSWLLAFLAFFTYEMTLVLPLLIVLYEICFKKLTLKNAMKRFIVLLPYLLILGGYLLTRFYFLKIGSRGDYLGPAYLPASNQAKLGAPEIILKYLYLLIFPANLTISYPVPDGLFQMFYKTASTIDPTGRILKFVSDYVIVFPLIVVGSLVLFIIKFLRKGGTAAFSICWFLISLLPILNILPQGAVMAERFLYIPSFGFCLLLGLGFYKLTNSALFKSYSTQRVSIGSLIFVLIISAYCVRTILRNVEWKDQESIFLSAHRLEPRDMLPNAALGAIKIEQNKLDESIQYSKQALVVNPNDAHIRQQLGLAYELNGDWEKAILAYKQSLASENNYYFSNIGLGNIYKKQGKFDEAIIEYQTALKQEPSNFDALFNLAGVYVQKKEYPQAIEAYQKALEIRPNQAAIFSNLGFIEEVQGSLDTAIAEYKKALELEPENFHFHMNLGTIYEKSGDLSKALEELRKAREIKPEDKEVREKIISLERLKNH